MAPGPLATVPEVFRRPRATGRGGLPAPWRGPLLARIFAAACAIFARNRLRGTGRAGVARGAGDCGVTPPGRA